MHCSFIDVGQLYKAHMLCGAYLADSISLNTLSLAGVMALGYIAAFSETLALTVIASEGIPPLLDALVTEIEDHIKSASAWSLGQIGRHSPNHAKAVAEKDVLPALVNGFISKTSSEDLQTKCKKAIKGICDRLTHFPALDSIMQVGFELTFLRIAIIQTTNLQFTCSVLCSMLNQGITFELHGTS